MLALHGLQGCIEYFRFPSSVRIAPNARCEFHMGGIGHWTNRCFNRWHRIQDLIDAGLLRFEKDESKVNQNASPVKGNVEGSPLTDVATKGREGLDSSLLTSSPVASDPFPEAGVTQGRQ